jgi:hypothetical protein
MTLVAGQVRVAGNGEISVAATTVTAPTDATTALVSADWTGLGYNVDSGLTVSRSLSTTNIQAWQSKVPVRIVATDQTLSVAGEFLQSNPEVVGLWYSCGAFAAVSGSTSATDSVASGDINPAMVTKSMVMEWEDGDVKYRLYIPKAQVTANGDQTVAASGAVTYPLMFTALAPDTGTTMFDLFSNDPAVQPSGS